MAPSADTIRPIVKRLSDGDGVTVEQGGNTSRIVIEVSDDVAEKIKKELESERDKAKKVSLKKYFASNQDVIADRDKLNESIPMSDDNEYVQPGIAYTIVMDHKSRKEIKELFAKPEDLFGVYFFDSAQNLKHIVGPIGIISDFDDCFDREINAYKIHEINRILGLIGLKRAHSNRYNYEYFDMNRQWYEEEKEKHVPEKIDL